MSNRDGVSGIEEFTPSKETYTSLKSDVDLELAIQELIDNAIDAWERHSRRGEAMEIGITSPHTATGPDLIIKDDAGGVRREEAPILFALGRTAKSDVPGTIGTFGLGAKKALVNLGVPFTIASWHEEEEIGWEYTITREWLEKDDDWNVPIETNEELSPGETEIRIHDLDYEWDADTVNQVKSRLESTYNLLLDDSLHTETYDLTINVDGQTIQPVGLPDWAYSPFDEIVPRRFENIELDLESIDDPINLHITVGLLRKKDGQSAGTDIYCQNRKVVTAARDEVGGFGSGRNRLGNFTVHHERLKVLVELETESDAGNLPWDTQKSSINRHSEVMKEVHGWMTSVVKPYFDLTDSVVPRAFVEFYPRDSQHAANGGEILQHEYSDRHSMAPHHKPNTSVPDIAAMQQRAKAHKTLGFRCYSDLEAWERPAYNNQLDADLPTDQDYTDLPEIGGDEPLDGLDETEAQKAKNMISELAKIHARNGIRYDKELKPWQKPTYDRYFEQNITTDLDAVESPPEELPVTPEEADQRTTRRSRSQNSSSSANGSEDKPAGSADEDPDPLPEANIAVAMIVNDDDGERISNLIEHDQVNLSEALGLPPDAPADEIHDELQRRLRLMVEFDVGADQSGEDISVKTD